ncbi:MAG: PHP domain-containing protein, partial [Clostridia bacterium]|nr:PHP domain-containing protein [Clostridia bacterium]
MMSTDLHTHTVYSDGKNTPEEMVLSAIEKGLKTIGISDHSYTSFDDSYCMKKETIDDYIKEITILKEKYRDKIEILCGIEQDLFSGQTDERFDYSIGSVHYFKFGEEYIDVDDSVETLKSAAEKYFGGDIYSLLEEYYRL